MDLLYFKKKEVEYLDLAKDARKMRSREFEEYLNLDKRVINNDIVNKFKENNYEFIINHEKHEIIIKDTQLNKDFIILKFAPIFELYTFIEYLNSLEDGPINEIIKILNVVDHEIPVIKEKSKKHITFRRYIIKDGVHQATNYLKINLQNYVINNYDFEIDMVLNRDYQELMKTPWYRRKYKILSINLYEFLYTLEIEEKETMEMLLEN